MFSHIFHSHFLPKHASINGYIQGLYLCTIANDTTVSCYYPLTIGERYKPAAQKKAIIIAK